VAVTQLPPRNRLETRIALVKLRVAVGVVVLSVSLAACGGSSAPAKHAVKPGDHLAAVKFASCMRSHGVPNFPDPAAGHGFQFPIDSVAEVSSPAFKGAQQDCKTFAPPGGPPRSGGVTRSQVVYAQCMRKHGFKHYPDPTANDQGPAFVQAMQKAGIDMGSPAFSRASKACNSG
jgi:hypothetical protein